MGLQYTISHMREPYMSCARDTAVWSRLLQHAGHVITSP